MASGNSKSLKKQAIELMRMGDKVYHYRKDVLQGADIKRLKENTSKLEALYKNKQADIEELSEAIETQEAILKKTGGTFWHNRFMSENIETIMVVAIVIIAFRIFFFQPFVIPTSSMSPTYSGMEPKTYARDEAAPNLAQKVSTKLIKGGSHYSIEAENSGEIKIPINPMTGSYYYRNVKARKWLVLPSTKKEYIIFIGNNPHSVKVPPEFARMEKVIGESFDLLGKRRVVTEKVNGTPIISTGIHVNKGDIALQFDILMGDALFVNRCWYHFAKPKSGDAFVFRTRDFKDRQRVGDLYIEKHNRVGEDKFYIKRLVGEPGMTLQVVDYRLLQNGKAATGAGAFEKNAMREGDYPGYRNLAILSEGQSYTIPENHYFAMGDNSANSKDSRYFGPVPENEIIGCASFIYYPFTKRWGLAK